MRFNRLLNGKLLFILLLSLGVTVSCSGPSRIEKLRYKRVILEQRSGKDNFFKNAPQSPLIPEQRIFFTGLAYFPPDLRYKVEAQYTNLKTVDEFQIKTSTGHNRVYVKSGRLDFVLDNKKFALFAYQEKARIDQNIPQSLFVPFTDLTTGKDTYGAGRYLDLEIPTGNRLILDFNLAYNPYCAYNDSYSCPIPPSENHLEFAVQSGEKTFIKSSSL